MFNIDRISRIVRRILWLIKHSFCSVVFYIFYYIFICKVYQAIYPFLFAEPALLPGKLLFYQVLSIFPLFLILLFIYKWSVKENNKNRWFFNWPENFDRF
jgi:uncharacterized membrane protein